MYAATRLPRNCVAAQPSLFFKKTIKESELNEFLKSANWGQAAKGNKYWTVYSDRSHNTTYKSSSSSSRKYDELDFNEQVRIAKIENGYALVYTENQKGVTYPLISSSAKSRGWIPMKNLLLWASCPTNEAGIYNKALMVFNMEELEKGNLDRGKRYLNPETKDYLDEVIADMSIYFVMKKADNGLVLLAREYKMEGYAYKVLYGWVNTNSYVPWSQLTCIEPNWKPLVAEQLKGKRVNVYREGTKATDIELGRTNKITNNEATKYRLEPQSMRYPLLGDKSINKYHILAFVHPDGSAHVPTFISGLDNASAIIDNPIKESNNVINLIIVLDGTKSMENYYHAQKVIQQADDYFGSKNKCVKVGIVIYRDYTDGLYVTEHLSIRSSTHSSIALFLQNGGSYGIKCSPSNKTKALYKGLEVALDTIIMNYSPNDNNLLLVIGDCGNAIDDKMCLAQEDIVQKCTKNHIQLCAIQVRNENEQSFLLFRKQMGTIIRENLKALASKSGKSSKVEFKELTDGYSGVVREEEIMFFGEIHHPGSDQTMDIAKLDVIANSLCNIFNTSIKGRTVEVLGGGASADKSNFLERLFTTKQLEDFNLQHVILAFQGEVDKQKDGLVVWQPVIYISSDEFAQLMEKLQPVMSAANTGNRKPYVDAMKELLRSMIPDITPKEMDEKDVKEITALLAGTKGIHYAPRGRTLSQIMDDNIVGDDEFDGILADFRNNYNRLKKIRENKYDFSVERNKTRWYWIPVEDLP